MSAETDSTQPAPPRRGCTESEAALLWAMARFGKGDELLGLLPDEVEPILAEHLRGLDSIDKEQRDDCLQQWAEQDAEQASAAQFIFHLPPSWRDSMARHIEPYWQRAIGLAANPASAQGPTPAAILAIPLRPFQHSWQRPHEDLLSGDDRFDVRRLLELDDHKLTMTFELVGIYQLTEVVRGAGRRQTARMLRDLQGWHRDALTRFLRREREMQEDEGARIQEIFIALNKQFPNDQGSLILHLGMAFVAIAAGQRHLSSLKQLALRLPPALRDALMRYYRSNYGTSRHHASLHLGRSLDAIVAEGFLSSILALAPRSS